MIPELAYVAIANHNVDVISAFSTDAKVSQNDLVYLIDDKNCHPSYHAAPVIRNATLKAHPEIAKVLSALDGKITTEIMQKLNAEVDIKKRLPADVAREFLLGLQPNPA